MTHQEFIEVSNLCKDFENELNKRISEEFGIRDLHTIPWHYYKYLRRKLKLDLLPVEWDYNGNSYITVKIPSEETDCKEVPAIKNFLLFAKKEFLYYILQWKENKEKGYCKNIQQLWSKAGNKYKNQVCFYEGQYICFERLKYKLKSTEKARAYLLPESEQIKNCLYNGEKYQFWELCYKLKQEKIEKPYETALNLIIE